MKGPSRTNDDVVGRQGDAWGGGDGRCGGTGHGVVFFIIEHALRGDEVIVAKAGKPLVCIVPFHDRSPSNRVPGSAQGMFTMAKDFDAPLTEEDLAAWEK
jgi:antitoxin (DNA-binding transcriptional repressor) of toxin-antitoxin stability system